MTPLLRKLIALAAIVAPTLHLLSDVMEWASGFSPRQLWINYVAFVLMPFMIIGLYGAQLPKIGLTGLLGALLYGISFVFFAHTTLFALETSTIDYQTLWEKLGAIYTYHGVIMIAGGLLFSYASIRAGVLKRWAVILFLSGILLNLTIGIFPLPDIYQTLGSSLRNLGLIGMGIGLLEGESNK